MLCSGEDSTDYRAVRQHAVNRRAPDPGGPEIDFVGKDCKPARPERYGRA
jgi:hypothetical protein